jgi:hypothetical protein
LETTRIDTKIFKRQWNSLSPCGSNTEQGSIVYAQHQRIEPQHNRWETQVQG